MPYLIIIMFYRKTAKTLPIEATTSFTTMSLSPNGFLLVTGNECNLKIIFKNVKFLNLMIFGLFQPEKYTS
jgi:hypothetical protein